MAHDRTCRPAYLQIRNGLLYIYMVVCCICVCIVYAGLYIKKYKGTYIQRQINVCNKWRLKEDKK